MIREPAVAGLFYSDNSEELIKTFKSFFNKDDFSFKQFEGDEYPLNIMVPHAGYIYSGYVASSSYLEIYKNGYPETFIIICPNHTGIGKEISIFNEGEWISPLGNIEVDNELADSIIRNSKFSSADVSAHINEHAVEVQLPFLQYFSKNFKIVPIVMGLQNLDSSRDLAESIVKSSRELGKSYSIIASTDLSHFYNQEKANKLDNLVLEDISNMDEIKLFEDVKTNNITMCGYGPVMTTIIASKLAGKNHYELLDYKTSGDVTGDFSSVVGYGSGIFK